MIKEACVETFKDLSCFFINYFSNLYSSGTDIKADKMGFFSKNHDMLFIAEYFVFVRKVETKGQNNFSLSFQAARHAFFYACNRYRRYVCISGKFGLAHQ